MQISVLIVGAGPTGLVLALWLTKLGIRVRLIDKTAGAGTTSRALALHARNLELYRQLDIAEEVIHRGHDIGAANLWVQGRKKSRIVPKPVAQTLTPYPFLRVFPQDEHERLLIDRLKAFGVNVERQTELLSYYEQDNRVVARLRGPHGDEECQASYIMGCDGARSRVRSSMGIGFPGSTYQQVFYVADVEASGPAMDGELHADLDWADPLGLFPLKERGRARLIGTIRDPCAKIENLKFEDVAARATRHMRLDVQHVNWFSIYRVHRRVAEHFRKGRAFLLGDAAHIHSPVGGQGMNTGIGDAINIAWKLAAVIENHAPEILLDSYESERIAFARRLVATTDRMFSFATADGRIPDFIRTRFLPLLLPLLARNYWFRNWRFRSMSQVALQYRASALSAGKVGKVHGGDRLPWVRVNGVDNYDCLRPISWQVHVYGDVNTEVRTWCKANAVPLNVFAWRKEHGLAGLRRDALYLLRPDTYVALAEEKASGKALMHYFATRGIRP